jgi:tight adherence protein B
MAVVAATLFAVALAAAPSFAAEDAKDPAVAAVGDRISITQVDTSHFPTVRAAFGADESGTGDTPKLTFTENGTRVNGVSVYRGAMGQYEDRSNATLMLVLDTSLSMRGQRIQDAVAAAKKLIAHANTADRIGLATFGGDAALIVKPTADHDKVRRALDSVPLANRTTLFDGVELAAKTLAKRGDSRRAIILLSDGADTSSHADLDDATGAALASGTPVYSVAITSDGSTPRDLARLGNGTGGETHVVSGSGQLTGLFAELGRRILQPYWIEYRSSAPNRATIVLGIAAGSGAPDAVRSFRAVANSSRPTAGPGNAYVGPQKTVAAKPLVRLPDGPLGALIVALPFGLLLFWLSWSFLRKRTVPDVIARIDRYTRPANEAGPRVGDARVPMIRRIATPLLAIAESVLGHTAFFAKTRRRAEQAAIAIRPAELFGAMVSLAVVAGLIGLLLGGLLVAGIAILVFGSMPNIWLIMKARKRRNTFEDQLPDVLQGIASSLNAGHAFNQAINAMIKDAPQPTSEEFQRVMTEARLGMPIEEALQHMADRMGSDDFDFAVTTVNIQRTVGGSLAEILAMVGDTVRNRQQFRKKVKALTSMGQMSAYVLLGMPVLIALTLTVMSPSYMAPLFTTSTGHLMIAAGIFSMFLGYVACMKIVNVKV